MWETSDGLSIVFRHSTLIINWRLLHRYLLYFFILDSCLKSDSRCYNFFILAFISTLGRANLTRVTSPPNSTSRRFPSYHLFILFLYFILRFYFLRYTLPDFSSTGCSKPFRKSKNSKKGYKMSKNMKIFNDSASIGVEI